MVFSKELVVKTVLVVVLFGIIGIGLLALVFSLPTNKIIKNVEESIPILLKETDYFSITPGVKGSQQDNYSDAIYLNEALVGINDVGLFERILGGCVFSNNSENSPVQLLGEFNINSKQFKPRPEWYRFFNGYEIFVKFFLLFTNYSGIRQFNLFCEFVLLLLLCFQMRKNQLDSYIVPFLVSFLFVNPITLALCMSFAGYFYCTIIPCILILSYNEKLKKNNNYWFFFESIGAFCYMFNMNYFQLVSYGIVLCFYFLANGYSNHETGKEVIKTCLAFLLAWICGYAGLMVFKWIIYSITINPKLFNEMIGNILFRISSKTTEESLHRYYGIYLNAKVGLTNYWWVVLELLYVIIAISKVPRKRGLTTILKQKELILFVYLLLIVLLRYLVFCNHVVIHSWVMYRLLWVPIFAFNIWLVRISSENI